MGWKKYDDATGDEINPAVGIDVIVTLANGTVITRTYANWANIPKQIFDGQIAGETVAQLILRDVALVSGIRPGPRTSDAGAKRV